MKTKTQQFAEERTTLLGGMKSIVAAAKSAGRDLTPAEQRDLEASSERLREINAQVEKFKASADLMARLGAITPGDLDEANGGNLFSESDAEGFLKAARTKTSFGTTIRYKAPMTEGGILPPVGQAVFPALEPKATFALRDLFQAASAPGPTVRYYTLTNSVSSTGTNEVQSVTISGGPTGGSFTLTFKGNTTAAIAHNATGATVQTALEPLPSIGAGNVTVTGSGGGPHTVTFVGFLSSKDVEQMTATSNLTGGTSPAVTVATSTQGAEARGVGIVPEGGIKPESSVSYSPVDAELIKLATRFSLTDELSEDAPFLVREIQQSVLRAVLVRENQLVIDTINATSGVLTGTGASGTLLDIIATEIGEAEAINGQTPTALILNPTNLSTVRTAKASTGGSYFLDPVAAGPVTVHGVPLISTPVVTAGTAYLVTSGFGTFYSRGSLRVEAGFTGDDWIHNRLTIRAEERVLPAVNRPSLVTKLTLT